MLTLYEDGLRKVALGVTSLEEVKRVTQDQQEETDSSSAPELRMAAGQATP